MTNNADDNVSVLLGAAGGAFAAQTTFATGNGPQEVTVSDLNGDGYDDLVVANNLADSVSVLFNVASCTGKVPTIAGTIGDDVLTGTAGDDVISGAGGVDTIDGLGGNDVICGGSGDDDLDGGAGDDYVYGDDGVDVVAGGADKDTISGGDGNDTLTGDDGIDRLIGGGGADELIGGAGSDLADYRFIRRRCRCRSVTARTMVRAASDEGDEIHGDIERLRGGSAADTLSGDANANILIGHGGDDALTGGGGADELQGGDGADTLQGGDANDVLQGGTGADTLQGDAGSDLADYPRTAPVTVSIGDGANDGETGEGDDVQADVERLRGGSADDTLTGNAVANVIYGAAGNDLIDGNAGNDILYGQAGADTIDALDGPPFRDRLLCGTEADTTTSDAADIRHVDCETNTGF